MNTPVLELRKVDNSFGPIDMLHEISLKVNAGEVLCLLGDATALDAQLDHEELAQGRPTPA